MKVIGIIPARLESSRLPGKALVDICGLPMVIHTCKRTQMAKSLNDVYLATDNEQIRKVAESHGIKVIMTSTKHQTGSDRIAEACQQVDCDIVVNVQGDEPLVYPEHIDAIVAPMLKGDLQIAIGVSPCTKLNVTSDIKAVLDLDDNVMYCSREDLPSNARSNVAELLKMVFIVPFRKEFLLEYTSWEPTPLEQVEYNEYLRVLEHGVKLRAVKVEGAKPSLDTSDELWPTRCLMMEDKLKFKYMGDLNEHS